ncbi:MAG: NADH:flavin oxidoreductase [Candidatus Abyssobacteria bacterium SURF_17]|uniref:NADH:flavin oxidoreductase n=1 Tax=Candidatus Abyssobacteria bacterium SURF_17 TaxID=2093361 RepID=A0A419EUJ0_9BACT|nr:MAG: NADH:flavin oxidoreductase [Candidatus Abyssubacteria bacterium SURF_17]
MERAKFEYKTLEQIIEDCAKRALHIEFDPDLSILYEPIEIGGRKLGNRLAVHPMEGSDATADGKPGELAFHRWKRFASGGAKLLWGEAAAVVPDGRSNPRQLIACKENVRELTELVKQTRCAHRDALGTDSDFLIGIQLSHAGRHCFTKPALAFRLPVHDSFTVLDKRTREPLPADYPVVTDDYLEHLEESFVDAARAACDSGFDFIDIKQCHSYLLNELLAARTRAGKYGGTFENRTRFVGNVVRRIKDALADEILIASRLNIFDSIPFGKDPATGIGKPLPYEVPYELAWGVDESNPQRENLSEPIKLIESLSMLGVSMLSVSIGSPYWSPHLLRPFSRPVEGGYLSPEHPLVGVDRLFRLTGEIQKAFPHIPVVGAGYSWLRQFMLNAAAANVRSGRVTIVGAGRGALAYPEFAREGKAQGSLDSRKVCLNDSLCSNLLRAFASDGGKTPTGCPIRDATYREIYKLLK